MKILWKFAISIEIIRRFFNACGKKKTQLFSFGFHVISAFKEGIHHKKTQRVK